MFGLEEKSWALVRQLALEPLWGAGAEVWVFGSRARGDQKDYSDLDILVKFKDEAPQGLLGSIRMELEESSLPIKVDIVERKYLAASYVSNVEREKISL